MSSVCRGKFARTNLNDSNDKEEMKRRIEKKGKKRTKEREILSRRLDKKGRDKFDQPRYLVWRGKFLGRIDPNLSSESYLLQHT